MKKLTALFVSAAFVFGAVGYASAQTPSTPAPPAAKKDDMKTMDKMEKPKAAKKADKMADCMAKAGTDEAKKADCTKKYAAKKPAAKAEKK